MRRTEGIPGLRARAFLLSGWLLVSACVSAGPWVPAPQNGWTQWATAEQAGFDGAALEQARQQADRAKSAAVLAVYRGRVLLAWGDVARKLELHSVRKSLYAALYGIATEKGLVDLDATLASLGIDDLELLTAAEKEARLEHLLHARSGVYHPSAYAPSDMIENLPARGSHPPGTFWYYNNWDFNVAGTLLERAAGKPMGMLFEEWIARPIDMEDYQPGDVFPALAPGKSRWPALTFRMSTRDLARFGLLWLNRGRWNGRPIISADWIDRATRPASTVGPPGHGYAMMWWTYAPGSIPAERFPNAGRFAIVQARGTGGQTVFVVPGAELVVVHRADTDHGRQVSGREIWTLLDQILGARKAEPSPDARFTSLTPVALESQLPALEWPRIVELQPSELSGLTGEYRFAPGIVARVYLHEGRLFAFMPGQGEAELLATSPTAFVARVAPSASIQFDREDSGRASRLRVRLGNRELVGERLSGQ